MFLKLVSNLLFLKKSTAIIRILETKIVENKKHHNKKYAAFTLSRILNSDFR